MTNIDEIIARVRDEARQVEAVTDIDPVYSGSMPDLQKVELQWPSSMGEVLFQPADRFFICAANQLLLGKMPETSAIQGLLPEISSGRLSRLELLFRLATQKNLQLRRLGFLDRMIVRAIRFFKSKPAASLTIKVTKLVALLMWRFTTNRSFVAIMATLRELDIQGERLAVLGQEQQQLAAQVHKVSVQHAGFQRGMLGAMQAFSSSVRHEQQRLIAFQESLASRCVGTDFVDDLHAKVSADDDLSQDLDRYYLAFEDHFRGDNSAIAGRQRLFLPIIRRALSQSRGSVLDIACGRGEWLSILVNENIPASGVDLSAAMIDYCCQQGLQAYEMDALSALDGVPAKSLSAITSFHLVEHLPFDALFQMIQKSFAALAPGGVMILETPNPENVLVGSHTFYHDFTHRNPVTPTSLQFLAEYHGFTDCEVLRLNPYPDGAKVPGNDPLTERVNGHLCGPQDYALVAWKKAQS
ncbi:class I SAM-dependent methyltransferase [Chitinilyticum litopenaei]|uniref:class I SAM-dependent methyltransferase n=1 Tax=Chitinilyticum litopenaei TaxID=1121276 RepID=UPI0004092BBC|nr:class I SAM-dependent methyltransferase [Chitinilyticum litopenaei]